MTNIVCGLFLIRCHFLFGMIFLHLIDSALYNADFGDPFF